MSTATNPIKQMFRQQIAAQMKPMKVCSWCGEVTKDGDPENISHGICPPCAESQFGLSPAAKPDEIRVPSRSGRHSHFVNLKAGSCSCPDNTYRKHFCYHLRVARWSKWLRVSVETVRANIERGRILFGCKHGVRCSFCASGSDVHPSRESRLAEVEAGIRRDIQAA